MSLTITNAGNSVTPKAGPIRSGGQVIRVTPTVVAGATDANDVAIATTAIPNAVKELGGSSKLVGLNIIDYDVESHDMDIVFMQAEKQLGSINGAVDISDANLALAKLLGVISLDWSASTTDLVTSHVFTAEQSGATANIIQLPMLLQAEPNSTDVYFSIVVREAVAWAGTGNLELIFHIEYL